MDHAPNCDAFSGAEKFSDIQSCNAIFLKWISCLSAGFWGSTFMLSEGRLDL